MDEYNGKRLVTWRAWVIEMGWYDKVSGVSVVRTDAHTVDRGR